MGAPRKNFEKLSEKERALVLARREYARQWKKKNPGKQEEYLRRFYEKQAEMQKPSPKTLQ